jgi:hypothetical protein
MAMTTPGLKGAAVSTFAIPIASAGAIVESNLPHPAEDNAITREFRALKGRIDGHIQTYYHSSGGDDNAAAQILVSTLGDQSPIPRSRASALLANPKTRPLVLRASLAWILVQRIFLNGTNVDSFLPPHVKGVYAILNYTRMDDQSGLHRLSQVKHRTDLATSTSCISEQMANNDGCAI